MHNTSLIPLLLAGIVMLVVLFLSVVISIQLYLRKQKASIIERAQLLHAHEQQLMRARLEEQERVMLQVSRDMHDNLSQQVGFLQMNLKGLAETALRPEQYHFYVSNCQSITGRISNEMRNMSYSLNSDYIKARGLGELLEKEVAHINSGRSLSCRMEIDGLYRTLPPDTELIIYRIVQEALHNVMKHAHAGSIRIRLAYEDDCMHLYVTDDGLGFDPSSSRFTLGLGIHNMQQRAMLINAELRIDASPGSGCCVSLKVPKSTAAKR